MRPSRAIYSKHWETPFSLFSEVVLVEIGIVAIDFDHLRNEAPAWSPFELHDDEGHRALAARSHDRERPRELFFPVFPSAIPDESGLRESS